MAKIRPIIAEDKKIRALQTTLMKEAQQMGLPRYGKGKTKRKRIMGFKPVPKPKGEKARNPNLIDDYPPTK